MHRLGLLTALCAGMLFLAPAGAPATTLDTTSNPLDYARLLDGSGVDYTSIGTSAAFVNADSTPQSRSDAEALFSGAPAELGFTSGVVLTTGSANAIYDAGDGGYQAAIWKNEDNNDANPPADYVAANGGTFPNRPGSPGPTSPLAHDSSMLELRLKP